MVAHLRRRLGSFNRARDSFGLNENGLEDIGNKEETKFGKHSKVAKKHTETTQLIRDWQFQENNYRHVDAHSFIFQQAVNGNSHKSSCTQPACASHIIRIMRVCRCWLNAKQFREHASWRQTEHSAANGSCSRKLHSTLFQWAFIEHCQKISQESYFSWAGSSFFLFSVVNS